MKPTPERWIELWQAIGAVGDPLLHYATLAAAYSEPHRHYHNLRHIAECLDQFDLARSVASQPTAIEMAIWYHDAVYDPKASDNEERSAALASRSLASMEMSSSFIETVRQLVMATKHHDANSNPDADLLVDTDLSILGQTRERFDEYESQIRREYAWVPTAEFVTRRTQILMRFLDRPKIYATDIFGAKHEQQARVNIERSLRRLSSAAEK